MQPKAKPVMIVDDDFEIRSALGEVLEDEGYSVIQVANGQKALDVLRSGLEPSLILLDLMMPIMDGAELCKRWRADAGLSKAPVIIVSADAETEQKAAALGAAGWLKKPVELEALLLAVGRFT